LYLLSNLTLAHQYRITVYVDGVEFSFIHVIQLKVDSKDPSERAKEIQQILAQKRLEIFGSDQMPKITRIDEL
jgi:hypothetical protein